MNLNIHFYNIQYTVDLILLYSFIDTLGRKTDILPGCIFIIHTKNQFLSTKLIQRFGPSRVRLS